MNSEGSGLGLQIHGGFTSQWFESTFCAFFYLMSIIYIIFHLMYCYIGSGGVVGYHASLTHWRSRVRSSPRIFFGCSIFLLAIFVIKRQWCIGNIEASQALAPGSTPGWRIFLWSRQLGDSLVVMTSALHAEGREFNPRSEHNFFFRFF